MFTVDLPWKAIGYGAMIAIVLSMFSYASCQGKKAAQCKLLLKEQIGETAACNESVEELETALSVQTAQAEEARVIGETAEALYYELLNKPPEIRIVPRERIVEVIRPGDCDRAALDAWDLLHGGDATWDEGDPTISQWRDFYSSAPSSAWGAAPPNSVLPNSHVVSEFRLYATGSGFLNPSPPLNGQQTWIYGQIVSPATR